MPPATPSSALPKSNFQASIAAASPEDRAAKVNATTVEEDAVPQARIHEQGGDVALESEFKHPAHSVPAPSYDGVENLVIVCCHAIFHPDIANPSFPLHSPLSEGNWHLAPFQRSDSKTGKPGEHETFLAHINAGLDTLMRTTDTLTWSSDTVVVFSGGATKQALTPLSEARSYHHAALADALSKGQRGGGDARTLYAKGRILLEENATDSFQNLLFSILLFRQTTGRYPRLIRIITHAFKSKRFLDLHAPALRWPSDRVRVEGIDPVMSSAEQDDTLRGEERFGYAPWQEDPFGTGEFLSGKRKQRGWKEAVDDELGDGLEDSVKQLLRGEAVESLPWTERPDSAISI